MPRPADRQLTALVLAFAERGITDRGDRIRLCSDHAGRRLTSSAQLTPEEVELLIGRLRALPAGTDLHRIVAQLVADEENEAATRAAQSLVCTRGRGQPTEGDLEQVAAFGRFLEQAGPPPAVRIGVDLARDGDDVVVTSVEEDGQITLL